MAAGEWANRNKITTPISSTISPEETVTIIDPRHPLAGRILPLLEIIQKQKIGACCVVLLPGGVEHIVPLAVTDRTNTPPSIFPLPIHGASLEQLLATFERIMAQSAKEQAHGNQRADDPIVFTSDICGEERKSGSGGKNLDIIDARPTTNSIPSSHSGVPTTCPETSDGGEA